MKDTLGIALLLLLALACAWASSAQMHAITLRGKLLASEQEADNGLFFLDPEGDSESITLMVNAGGYVSEFLHGSVGHTVTVTVTPRAAR